MRANRLEAFSDGVIAIILTIMVLELKAPHDPSLEGLLRLSPIFLSYILSYLLIAIYWVNHHHLIHMVQRVDARILWANINLLFWMSLIPWSTAYVGQNCKEPLAVGIYGFLALACAGAFYLLRGSIACQHRSNARLTALHVRLQRKNAIAVVIYAASVPMAWISIGASFLLILLPAVMYFIPDSELEKLQKD